MNNGLLVLVIAVAFVAGFLFGYVLAEEKCLEMIDEALKEQP